ncbi:MAG TPA: autotransporter outer membrane beta-barrel domain-containing protein [Candidatus Aphodousia faecavium]|nr:autotransporter outer membrane beta-barrel domain-containing protein [Candidatus Aphodousia faecavium]
MNRIYKSIWNQVTQSFTAVSEVQHTKGKKSRTVSLSGVLFATLLPFSLLTHAATIDSSYTDGIVFGLDQSVTYSDPLSISNSDKNLNINFDFNQVRRFDTENDLSLIEQSQGFNQKFLTLTNFSYPNDFTGENISITDSLSRDFMQNVYQDNGTDPVAQGIYILGDGAYKLQNLNKNILGDPTVGTTGITVSLPSQTGTSTEVNVEVLSMLVGLSLQSGQELTLDIDGDQSFYAKLLGKGSVNYQGRDKSKDKLTITDLNYGDLFQGSTTFFPHTDYVGSTTFENVTALIQSSSGLGGTSSLELINSDVRKDDSILVQGDIRIDENSTIASLTETKSVELQGQNIFVHNAESLDDSVSVNVSGDFRFVSATGTNQVDIDAKTIVLTRAENGDASKVIYDQNAEISADSTIIEGGSSLAVHGTDQIKGLVSFGNTQDQYNSLTIKQTQPTGEQDQWSLGTETTFSSTDNQSIIVVEGLSPHYQFALEDNEEQWKNYQGWIHVTNSRFTVENSETSIFNRNENSVGLSVGHGGIIHITDQTTIDRLAWANDISAGQVGGILDLTHFEPKNSDTENPVLTVHELHLDGPGYIFLDPTKYLDIKDVGNVQLGGSVLDYDESDHKQVIIQADQILDQILGENDRIHLVTRNEDGSFDEDSIHTQHYDLFKPGSTDRVAEATWGYNIAKEQIEQNGEIRGDVYVGYSLNQLELFGSKNADLALEIDLTQATDNRLSAKIIGDGIIEIHGNEAKNTVRFSNYQNDFNGLVDVGSNLTFEALSGALGQGGVALLLGENSSYKMVNQGTQKLNGLVLSPGSRIKLNAGSELELALNTTYLRSDHSVVKNATIGDGHLQGAGTLSLTEGTLLFSEASKLFDDFTGTLKVKLGAEMQFDGTGGFLLQNLHDDGTATLLTDSTLGNLESFTGLISLGDKVALTLNNTTDLNSTPNYRQSIQGTVGNSVVFDDFDVNNTDQSVEIDKPFKFENIDSFKFKSITGTFGLSDKQDLTLADSTIVRRVDSLDKVSMDSDSSIFYEIKTGQDQYNLEEIKGLGTLGLLFNGENQKLNIDKVTSEFKGTLRFDNAIFEIGSNHQASANADLASQNALYVGQSSTLVMNGSQTMGGDLTLAGGSCIDFSQGRGNFVTEGVSANAIDMNQHSIDVVDAEDTKIKVTVDSDVKVDQAYTGGTLMEAVRVDDEIDLNLVLIDNIGSDINEAKAAMQLDNISGHSATAVVDYKDIADITTGVSLQASGDEIGLAYNTVTQVAIYDGVEAVFETTNAASGDVISADIVNKGQEGGSVRFTGNNRVILSGNNSYTGTTTLDGNVILVANAGTLGQSEHVIVGTTDGAATLLVNGSQNIGGLSVQNNGAVNVDADAVMTITDSDNSDIFGELSGNGTINLVNSQLTYHGTLAREAELLEVIFITDEKSNFIKTGANVIDFAQNLSDFNLNLNQGGVILDNRDSLNNLTVQNGTTVDVTGKVNIANLSGSGATFNMAVAFGEGSQEELVDGKAGLHIDQASGEHFVHVTSKDLNKGAEEKIKVIEVGKGDASFALANGLTAITSGGYDYELVANAAEGGSGTDYFLDSASGPEHIRNTTVTAGSYIGIAYAAQLFDLSLHDRVGNRDWINPVTGEKQTTSLWMHHTMSHERYRDSTAQLRMHTTSNTTMLGGDLVQFTTGDTGLAYAGLMGGYGTMDTKSRSKVTHLHSKAETDAWGVGAYAGWKANSDGQTGPYVDGWVMFTHASSDVTGVDQNTEDVKGQGLSASLEAGWGFKVGSVATKNGKVANFTVEPHASVTWFGMQYDEIHNEAQDVKFEGENNVRTRLGARAILSQEGNNNFNAFVEANWVHNTQEYGATISGLTVDQAGSRNQGEGRIGVDWRVTDSLSVWGRVGASFGSDNYNEREGSIGVRYQF